MSDVVATVKVVSEEEKARLVRVANKPPLDECLSLYDLEVRWGLRGGEGGADGVRSVGCSQVGAPDCRLGVLLVWS